MPTYTYDNSVEKFFFDNKDFFEDFALTYDKSLSNNDRLNNKTNFCKLYVKQNKTHEFLSFISKLDKCLSLIQTRTSSTKDMDSTIDKKTLYDLLHEKSYANLLKEEKFRNFLSNHINNPIILVHHLRNYDLQEAKYVNLIFSNPELFEKTHQIVKSFKLDKNYIQKVLDNPEQFIDNYEKLKNINLNTEEYVKKVLDFPEQFKKHYILIKYGKLINDSQNQKDKNYIDYPKDLFNQFEGQKKVSELLKIYPEVTKNK